MQAIYPISLQRRANEKAVRALDFLDF